MGNGDVNIYLEIFGYTGTVLIIISMMMTSMLKLRIFNICGGIISTIYSAYHGAWAVVVMNICLIGVNVYQIIRELRRIKSESKKDTEAEP